MQVTLAQLAPRPREVRANLKRAREVVGASAESELVVFPELFLSGYQLRDAEPLALELNGPELAELRAAAGDARTAVIVGAAERWNGAVANSAVCIDASGELAGVYRKTHPFGPERGVYAAGDELLTVELGGRVLGLMICFDMEFPEVGRTLARRGADMLVTISANSSPYEIDHAVFARARALENGLPHVYVNRVGEEDGLAFCGGSLAVDPDARTLAEAGHEGEATVGAELGAPGRRDPETSYLDRLRGELYDQGSLSEV